MQKKIDVRELSEAEIETVSGAVHLGGFVDRLAQYLWSRSLT